MADNAGMEFYTVEKKNKKTGAVTTERIYTGKQDLNPVGGDRYIETPKSELLKGKKTTTRVHPELWHSDGTIIDSRHPRVPAAEKPSMKGIIGKESKVVAEDYVDMFGNKSKRYVFKQGAY